ncbi:MAG: adenylate/guanylate cyclase domain-containing protein [Pedosphaera sp.]|nr:adenylate/guanylate cyclase domain-containing protein [Pedosphaera sp.]
MGKAESRAARATGVQDVKPCLRSANGNGTEQRKLAAIMFTDMVGYSALTQCDEALALKLLEEHRSLLRALFSRFCGREVKTIGDAFLVEFHSVLEAAQCAIEIQRALAKRNPDVPAARRIEVKIGIHIGDVVQRADGDVLGDGVNIASRIEPLAGANGICISVDVERQIRNTIEASLLKLGPTECRPHGIEEHSGSDGTIPHCPAVGDAGEGGRWKAACGTETQSSDPGGCVFWLDSRRGAARDRTRRVATSTTGRAGPHQFTRCEAAGRFFQRHE